MSRNWLNDVQLKDFQLSGKVGYGYGLGVRTLIDDSRSRSPIGEFGWDGAAGCYVLIDPKNQVGLFYAQEILGMLEAYVEIRCLGVLVDTALRQVHAAVCFNVDAECFHVDTSFA